MTGSDWVNTRYSEQAPKERRGRKQRHNPYGMQVDEDEPVAVSLCTRARTHTHTQVRTRMCDGNAMPMRSSLTHTTCLSRRQFIDSWPACIPFPILLPLSLCILWTQMMEAEEAERIINEPGPAPAAAASNQLTAQEQMMLENATASADSMAE